MEAQSSYFVNDGFYAAQPVSSTVSLAVTRTVIHLILRVLALRSIRQVYSKQYATTRRWTRSRGGTMSSSSWQAA